MATLSVAETEILVCPLTVAPSVGETIVTVGGVVSGAETVVVVDVVAVVVVVEIGGWIVEVVVLGGRVVVDEEVVDIEVVVDVELEYHKISPEFTVARLPPTKNSSSGREGFWKLP